jgi:O-antigen/teichoic acid export membrane protein
MEGKKEFVTSGAVYTILGFLPTASRFFLLPIFLHYLSPADFALISLNTMVATILPPFMTFGLETSMNRYYFDFARYPKIEKAFLSTLIISIITLSLCISLLFVLFGPQVFSFSFKSQRFTFFPFGFTALLYAIPGGLYALYLNYLRCKKDLRNYVALNLGLFVLTTAGEITAIIFLKMHVEQLVWIKPIIMVVFVSAATFVLLLRSGIHFDKRLLRLALNYSTPLLPHLIFGLVFVYADRVMIERNLDLTYLAIYNLTMAISNIVDIFEQALRNATFPNIYKLLKENVYTNIDAVSKIHTINGLILLTILSGIAMCTPVAAYYLLKPVYLPLVFMVPFALIISIIRFYYIVYGEPLFFFKKIKHISAATFLQGSFAILFNFLLIPRFGLMGALLANIMSKIIQVIYLYFITLGIKIFKYRLRFILTATTMMIAMLISVTFVSRIFAVNKLFIHIVDCLPFIFTSGLIVYFMRANKISLKRLW